MSLSSSRIFPQDNIRVTVFILLVFFGAFSVSLAAAAAAAAGEQLTKSNGKPIPSEQHSPAAKKSFGDVFPIKGLTTGPPSPLLNMSEAEISEDKLLFAKAQRRPFVMAETASEGNENITESAQALASKAKIVRNLKKGTTQRSQKSRVASSQRLKGRCLTENTKDRKHQPAKDTVELYHALENIIEHVTGIDYNLNDPEEMRMRAYVGERKAIGVQIILQEETHFWASSLMGEARPLEDPDDFAPVGDSSFEVFQEEAMDNKERNKIEVKEGARLRLVCNVTGVPSYWVEWRRGANLSFPGGASVVGGRSVLLDYVGREDAGLYSCKATTPSGHSHISAVSISVQYPPVVGVWARDVSGNELELGCLVEGRPRPLSAWYMNNTKISSDFCPRNAEMRSSVLSSRFVLNVLSLRNVTEDDFAYYHCRATSSLGVSRAYVMVHDDTGVLDLHKLANTKPVKHPAPLENPRLSSFLLGMVPPLYIGLYIIAYLGCYKTSISGMGAHGRFGAGIDLGE